MTIRRKLLNFGNRSTDLRFGCGAFSELSKMLAGAVGRPCRAFMIADTELDEALLVQVRRSLIDAGYRVDELMLDGLEAARFTSVSRAYERLAAAGITSEDLVLGVGPAAVCSLAAFASHGWCGGTSCALIPTTLDAMVRLPTQMEPLSVAGDAHAVSVSPQVSLVVCDLDLVVGRDVDANGMGYVLICAAHLAESRKCWEGFAGTVEGLAQHGEIAFIDAICTAQTSRLNTAKSASPSARRAFMYGQTTARALSACLGMPPSSRISSMRRACALRPVSRSMCATSRSMRCSRKTITSRTSASRSSRSRSMRTRSSTPCAPSASAAPFDRPWAGVCSAESVPACGRPWFCPPKSDCATLCKDWISSGAEAVNQVA